jgi:hypothetical protein
LAAGAGLAVLGCREVFAGARERRCRMSLGAGTVRAWQISLPPVAARRPRTGPHRAVRSRAASLPPHDSVFRRIFGVPANAASQLRAILPPDLAARLDLTRLAPVPGSFVDEALRWRHSDVLFTAPLDGRDAFVYVLVEHQSSDDPLMAFRVLRYIVRIWDQYKRAELHLMHHSADSRKWYFRSSSVSSPNYPVAA